MVVGLNLRKNLGVVSLCVKHKEKIFEGVSLFNENRPFLNGRDAIRISAHSLAFSASKGVRATEILAWSNLEPKKSMIEAKSVEDSANLPPGAPMIPCW